MAVVKNICVEAIGRHCSSGETGRLDQAFARRDFDGASESAFKTGDSVAPGYVGRGAGEQVRRRLVIHPL